MRWTGGIVGGGLALLLGGGGWLLLGGSLPGTAVVAPDVQPDQQNTVLVVAAGERGAPSPEAFPLILPQATPPPAPHENKPPGQEGESRAAIAVPDQPAAPDDTSPEPLAPQMEEVKGSEEAPVAEEASAIQEKVGAETAVETAPSVVVEATKVREKRGAEVGGETAPPVIEPEPATVTATALTASGGAVSQPVSGGGKSYFLQLGTYRLEGSARHDQQRYREMGIDAQVHRRGGYYVLRLEPFATRSEAERVEAQLKARGVEPLFIPPPELRR